MISSIRPIAALLLFVLLQSLSPPGVAQDPAASVEAVKVVAQMLERNVSLPGDLNAYQSVDIYSKVTGFAEMISVDRGSVVKKDQLLATIGAPELTAQISEAQARIQTIASQRVESMARLAAAEDTHRRLKAAAATPGVVAGNDLDLAEKSVEAERARLSAIENGMLAAEAALKGIRELQGYLRITAPFDGVVTQRNLHPGSLVGPGGGAGGIPLLRIEQISNLRLVVPVPEGYVGSVQVGTRVRFTLPAYPGESFEGVVRRSARSLEIKTRTMPVEMDVRNPGGRLAPGMYASVDWPVRRAKPSLFVPPPAIATTTERSFVVRLRDGIVEWVDVRRGVIAGDLVEVFGDLVEGDLVARRGTDELRPGTRVRAQLSPAQ